MAEDAIAHDADDSRRFGGLQRLYGLEPAARIQHAHVVVVGIGGVGSWCAEALARSGVRRLTLIDMDHIAESNVNRQIHSLTSTLGQAKIEAMRDRIAQIHPGCQVDLVDDFVSPDNWPALLPAQPDALIDACDQVKAKQAMYKLNVDSPDKSLVKFDLGHLVEATHLHVQGTMSRKKGSGLVFINCMEKLTMNAPRDTLRVRLTAALDAGIDGRRRRAGLDFRLWH